MVSNPMGNDSSGYTAHSPQHLRASTLKHRMFPTIAGVCIETRDTILAVVLRVTQDNCRESHDTKRRKCNACLITDSRRWRAGPSNPLQNCPYAWILLQGRVVIQSSKMTFLLALVVNHGGALDKHHMQHSYALPREAQSSLRSQRRMGT